jgi:hypothetical protein
MMENKDQPIYPAMMQQVGNESYRLARTNDPKEWNVPCIGLTKREYFAAMAMQGLLSHSMDWVNDEQGWCAENAVRLADDLLTELSKTESSSSQSNRG